MSTRTPAWRIVAEREMRTRLRDKTFLLSTGFTLLLIVGVIVVSAFLGARGDQYDVAVGPGVDSGITDLAAELIVHTVGEGAELETRNASDADAVERLVEGGDVDAGLVATDSGLVLLGDDGVDPALQATLTTAVGEWVLNSNASAADVDLEALRSGTSLDVRLLDPNADEASARSGVAFAFVILFLLTAMTFGMTIAASVVQEKESRVVEILAAAVPIRALLWGKIAGNTALAVGQIVLLAVVGVIGLIVTDQGALLRGVGWSILWYIGFFVLGFVTLACLWSVAGSLAGRQEDLQSTTLPGQMILFVPYFVAIFAGEQVRTIMSMLPIVSSMIMPGRMAEGSVPWWQVGVAVGVTLLAAALFVRLGSRLYERTLLRTGSRITYRDAWKLPTD